VVLVVGIGIEDSPMVVVIVDLGGVVETVGGSVAVEASFRALEIVIQSSIDPEQIGVPADSVHKGASVGQTFVSVGAGVPALTHGLKPLQTWPTSQQPPSLVQ